MYEHETAACSKQLCLCLKVISHRLRSLVQVSGNMAERIHTHIQYVTHVGVCLTMISKEPL